MDTPVVLITGALAGIGRAVAIAFSKIGNRVVVSGRKQDAGEALLGDRFCQHSRLPAEV
jgi:NADP-dependent 3-hydroxy acid dehydrogenase YdfG